MVSGRWIWDDRQKTLVSAHEYRRSTPKRSRLKAPFISTDTMEPVQSMADGKVYTSKKAIRETYKPGGNPQGVRYTEIGSDRSWREKDRPQPKVDPKAVETAVEKAFARYDRGERV